MLILFCYGWIEEKREHMVCIVLRSGKAVGQNNGHSHRSRCYSTGKTKAAMMKQNEASARLIAQELEKAVYGNRWTPP